jgi:hypothetical protein
VDQVAPESQSDGSAAQHCRSGATRPQPDGGLTPSRRLALKPLGCEHDGLALGQQLGVAGQTATF